MFGDPRHKKIAQRFSILSLLMPMKIYITKFKTVKVKLTSLDTYDDMFRGILIGHSLSEISRIYSNFPGSFFISK